MVISLKMMLYCIYYMNKRHLFLIIILSQLFFGVVAFAQNEITPVVNPENTILSPCKTDQNCYPLLEGLPTNETGELIQSIDTTSSGSDGIGGFINFIFQIGLGVAGVIGVVMLTVYGFQYAANDKNVQTFAQLKEKILGVVMGLLLLLGIFVILKTINPDLLIVEPDIGKVVASALDQQQIDYINSIDVSGVVLPPDEQILSDKYFIAYLYHQQGEGGAPAIIYSAKRGWSKVGKTPFVSRAKDIAAINNNIWNQLKRNMSPSEFIQYFYKRYLAKKQSGVGKIYSQYAGPIDQAAREVGVDATALKIECMLEALYGCEKAGAEKHTNGSEYKGLFQFGDTTFKSQKKDGCDDIFNALCNSYAGANFMKYNLSRWEKNKNKM